MKRFIIRPDRNRGVVQQNVVDLIGSLPDEKEWLVIIEEYVPEKTSQQRKGFHYLVGVFAKELGYSPDEMKQVVKAECFGIEMVEVAGRVVEVIKPSEEADKVQYADLISTCYRLAAECGIVLPDLINADIMPPGADYENTGALEANNV